MEKITNEIKKWLTSFILKHHICPFARREYEKDSIIYDVILSDNLEEQLHALILACKYLDENIEAETTLIIFPNGLESFDDYLDFLALSDALMNKQGYEGIYQLASFHPNYCFDGVDTDDASNYSNRSPYPMLHLIREKSLEKVLEHYPNPEKIPERNIEYIRELGVDYLLDLLRQCKR